MLQAFLEAPNETLRDMFQWAPTLGGECYGRRWSISRESGYWFQWAPTLVGECYPTRIDCASGGRIEFQWAPTLVGECYSILQTRWLREVHSFNGHPPLWVNATNITDPWDEVLDIKVSMGTHPCG